MGLRDDLLGRKLATEDVFVPEWQLTITLREMSGAERDSFEQACTEGRDSADDPVVNVRAKLLVRSIIEGGERVFGDDEAHMLGGHSGAALDRLGKVAQRLSKVWKQAAEQAEKNSAATPGDASSSGSPSSSAAESASYSPD